MKKKLMLFGCIFVLILSSTVLAEDGLYSRLSIGSTTLNDSVLTSSSLPGEVVATEYGSGMSFTGAIGSAAGDQTRIEVELGYSTNDIDSFKAGSSAKVTGTGKLTSLSALFNSYYDFRPNSAFTPYIGGGFGIAKIDIGSVSVANINIPDGDTDTVFAYQFGGGIGLSITDKITVDLGYRYFGTTDDPAFGLVDAEYDSHNYMVGFRYGH